MRSYCRADRDSRRGFTIVEVLVCIFIIGIILAIALPAVQQSREVARAIHCRSNLHNIGIACHSHVATMGYFPAIGKVYPPGQYGFSYLVQLLPYVEQQNLLDKFNLAEIPSSLMNQQVTMENRVSLWLCPVEADSPPSQSNYLGNFGTGISDDLEPLEDGFLAAPPGARPAEFTRGLSNTVAVSECRSYRSAGDGVATVDASITSVNDWEAAVSVCRHLDAAQADAETLIGQPWLSPSVGASRYNHILPPGENSCMFGGKYATSIVTANSRHGESVHCLHADGSVVKVSFGIDFGIWRDLGRRDLVDNHRH